MRKHGRKIEATGFTRFIKPCGRKSARIAPPNTLTEAYTQLLPKAQPYLNFLTRKSKSKPHIITLLKYTVLIHWWVVYAILLVC